MLYVRLRVLSRVRWSEVGVEDALLIAPETQPGGMRKCPPSIREALATLSKKAHCHVN